MAELTEKIITQIAEEMYSGGTCIECGGVYFHAPLCQKGFGLDGVELVRRLKERATKMQPCEVDECAICGKSAQGTFWVAYHGYKAVLQAIPSCDNCASLQTGDAGRPSGFLPYIVTDSTAEVHRILKNYFIGAAVT